MMTVVSCTLTESYLYSCLKHSWILPLSVPPAVYQSYIVHQITVICFWWNRYGKNIPNYHYEDLIKTINLYEESKLINPAIIVDANHSNSGKKYAEQPRIVREVLESRKYNSSVEKMVKGVMIESYIEPGNQKIDEHIYGKSITDPCLGWDETEKLLHYIAENV